VEGGDQGSEERVIEAKVEAEKNEDTGGDGFGEAAVEIHGLIDPITVAHVPEEAAEVSEGGSLARSKWISCLGVTEERPK
jgi:hypothetical protein